MCKKLCKKSRYGRKRVGNAVNSMLGGVRTWNTAGVIFVLDTIAAGLKP